MAEPAIIVIMGVAGSGKSTIGMMLAAEFRIPFFDADDFHPRENKAKMKAGIALNDEDRAGWLVELNMLARQHASSGAIIACSALKQQYREKIAADVSGRVHWVLLKGDYEQILGRMNQRKDHYMPPSLLTTQFDTLEPPNDAIVVDISASPGEIVSMLLARLS